MNTGNLNEYENMTHNAENKQLIENNSELTQVVELTDEDINQFYKCIAYVQKLSRDIKDM